MGQTVFIPREMDASEPRVGAAPDTVKRLAALGCEGSVGAGAGSAGWADKAEASSTPTPSVHGTHGAGTIAGAINGVGIAGVAPGVKVAAVKVVNDDGFIYPEAAVCGFVWAAEHGMQITNNTYFIYPWEFHCRHDARQRPVWQAV